MNKRAIAIGLLLTTLAAFAAPRSSWADTKASSPKTVRLADGLTYVDLHVGKGPQPLPGHDVTVHYVGTLTDGTKFDSSRDRNEPFTYTFGTHAVIPCWDEGLATMRPGGRRRLTCPPALAYGERGAGDKIPPNATLIFDVELLSEK